MKKISILIIMFLLTSIFAFALEQAIIPEGEKYAVVVTSTPMSWWSKFISNFKFSTSVASGGITAFGSKNAGDKLDVLKYVVSCADAGFNQKYTVAFLKDGSSQSELKVGSTIKQTMVCSKDQWFYFYFNSITIPTLPLSWADSPVNIYIKHERDTSGSTVQCLDGSGALQSGQQYCKWVVDTSGENLNGYEKLAWFKYTVAGQTNPCRSKQDTKVYTNQKCYLGDLWSAYYSGVECISGGVCVNGCDVSYGTPRTICSAGCINDACIEGGLKKNGELCIPDDDNICQSGKCVAGICSPSLSSIGGKCIQNNDCTSNLCSNYVCQNSVTTTTKATTTSEATTTTQKQCEENLLCPDGRTARLCNNGVWVTELFDCSSDSTTTSSVTTTTIPVICQSDADCDSKDYCNADGVCQSKELSWIAKFWNWLKGLFSI